MSSEYPSGIEIVVSGIIPNNYDEILLVRSQVWKNKWILPSTLVRSNLSLFNSLVVGIKQKTDISITPLKILEIGETIVEPPIFYRNAHFLGLDILCQKTDQFVQLRNKDWIEYKWLPPNKINPDDLAPRYIEAMQAYLRTL